MEFFSGIKSYKAAHVAYFLVHTAEEIVSHNHGIYLISSQGIEKVKELCKFSYPGRDILQLVDDYTVPQGGFLNRPDVFILTRECVDSYYQWLKFLRK